MRILVLADLDDCVSDDIASGADLLVSCGDVRDDLILKAAELSACRKIFAVKGNHDLPADFPSPVSDLHLKVERFDGLRFGGFDGCWKYKPNGNYLYGQGDARSLLAAFPRVDVFIAHNSPKGIHDRDDDVHQGFDAFNEYIARANPKYMLHGHQHLSTESILGRTRVVGVFGHAMIEMQTTTSLPMKPF